MNISRLAFAGASTLALLAFAVPPPTPTRPVTDTHHGVKVVDDYRWLEDWANPEVKAWSDAQSAHARAHLDTLASAPALRARFTELENSVGVEYSHIVEAGGRFFAAKNQPPKQQPMIVVLRSLAGVEGERVLLDPNALDKDGGTSFDWFIPSPDGRLLAVSLSEGGSESGNVHVFDVESGKEQPGDMVPRVNGGTAGGSLAWAADSKGFYYTRYPREGERPAADMDFYTQLYFHALGTPTAKDAYQVGKDYPKIAEIQCQVSDDGRWVLTNVQNGDGGEFIQDVRSPDGTWSRLSTWDDRVVAATFGPDGTGGTALFLVSRKGAPLGKVLKLKLDEHAKPALADARTIVREQRGKQNELGLSVQTDFADGAGIWTTAGHLFVLYQNGGPNELHIFDLDGHFQNITPPALAISTTGDVAPIAGKDELIIHVNTYAAPGGYWHVSFDGDGNPKASSTPFNTPVPPRMPKIRVLREFATSKDGTKVPVNIMVREDLLDASGHVKGPLPTILWGYGGYGVCEVPVFSRRRLPWIESGGIFAVANIRGGGEYGEAWHLAGNLTKKQNVFDDFHAAAAYLVDKKYASHDTLGLYGGSNGGLLMGATLTQHPDLCKVVVSSVGIYDMLRVELSPNGAFNVTEFGTVANPDHFRAMFAYSPYHHVHNGQKYPDVLFLTGANDPRVDPMQSRKMTARLQAAQATLGDKAGAVLLRTSGNTGHGAGTPLSARIEQSVDIYAFFADRLGLKPLEIPPQKP